ncbi:MAG: hypothetical protein WBX25_16825 [Rhodomicrobium sp.]
MTKSQVRALVSGGRESMFAIARQAFLHKIVATVRVACHEAGKSP